MRRFRYSVREKEGIILMCFSSLIGRPLSRTPKSDKKQHEARSKVHGVVTKSSRNLTKKHGIFFSKEFFSRKQQEMVDIFSEISYNTVVVREREERV